MQLTKVIESLELEPLVLPEGASFDVNGGYASDLLSDVLANAHEGDLWVTLQTHKNVIAVASMKKLSGVITVNNREPDQETLDKAADESVPVFKSALPAFEIVGRLYGLGIRGKQEDKP